MTDGHPVAEHRRQADVEEGGADISGMPHKPKPPSIKVMPLAVPLMAGPGAITTIILE